MAYNLVDKGDISLDGKTPTNFREPMPILFAAAYWKLFNLMPTAKSDLRFLEEKRYSIPASAPNILYLFITLITSALILRQFNQNFLITIIGVLSIWLFTGNYVTHLNTFGSEFMAMMWVTISAYFILKTSENKGIIHPILLGMTFGFLILTKGAAFYITIPTIILVTGYLLYANPSIRKTVLGHSLIIFGTMVLVVAPWVIRNHFLLNRLSITQRSDLVLLTRALKNEMTWGEYLGTFYIYSPTSLQEFVFEKYLGYSKDEGMEGGTYQRLVRHQPGDSIAAALNNPDLAISFYDKAALIQKKMLLSGQTSDDVQKVAMKMILSRPGKHLATSIPFAFRGIWSFPGRKYLVVTVINAASFLSLFALPFLGLYVNKPKLYFLTLFPFLYFSFHTVTTHFIPRYSFPLIPLALISLILVNTQLLKNSNLRKHLL